MKIGNKVLLSQYRDTGDPDDEGVSSDDDTPRRGGHRKNLRTYVISVGESSGLMKDYIGKPVFTGA